MSVTVYHIGPSCVQCNQTKKVLTNLGVEFDEVDLREHPDLTETFKEQGHLTAPIVVTDTKTWSGFKYDKLQALANHAPKPIQTNSAPFYCHGVEWDASETCFGCDAAKAERERIIAYLKAKGILRDSMLGNGLVAHQADKPEDGSWPIIDLPLDLGASK